MSTLTVNYTCRDWSLPPTTNPITDFNIYDSQKSTEYKLNDMSDVLDYIATHEKIKLYTIDLSLLLAYLLWIGNKIHYYKIIDYVRDGIIIPLDDLSAVTTDLRTWKTSFETSVPICDSKHIDDLGHKLEPFIVQQSILSTTQLELLSNVVRLCLMWKGAKIDNDLLLKGIQYYDSIDCTGIQLTLANQYHTVQQCLRDDNRIHPQYRKLATFRLGALYPQVQTFTPFGGQFGSKQLIVSDSVDLDLVCIDLRMAELMALGVILRDSLSDVEPNCAKLLIDLNAGKDIHMDVGNLVVSNPDDKVRRDVGKATNFALLNLANHQTINQGLTARGLPIITREAHAAAKQFWIQEYGVDVWHEKARNTRYPHVLTVRQGRLIKVYRPSQYTGYQFQSLAGDATLLGILNLMENGIFPNVMIHDEVVLCLKPQDVVLADTLYKQGVNKLLHGAFMKTKITNYKDRWGNLNSTSSVIATEPSIEI